MSGFLIAFGAPAGARAGALADQARRLHARERGDRVTRETTDHLFGYFVTPPSAPPTAADRAGRLFVYGALYRDRGADDPGDAAFALARYRQAGVDGLCDLNGSFVIGVTTGVGSLALVSDRIGSIPCYWRQDDDGTLVAASECKAMFGAGQRPGLSRDAVLDTLLFGRVKFSRAPLFAGVSTLEPGGVLRVSGEAPPQSRLYYRYRGALPDGAAPAPPLAAEEAADVLRGAVREQLRQADRVALSLSGGIDSRMLLAAVDPDLRHKVLAVSFGMPGNDESAIAQRVASLAGVEYRDIPLTPAYFVEHAEEAVAVSEGRDLFAQGYLTYVTERLRCEEGVDAMLDGMEVGVSLGGDYLRSEFDAVAPEELPAFLFRRFYVHRHPPSEVFLDDVGEAAARLIDGALAQVADVDSVYDRLDWVYVECYTREVMRLRHRLIRKRLVPLPITANRAYLDLVARVPARQKQERRFQLAVLAHLEPRLLDVPYHSTMLPLTVPRTYWPQGAQAITDWERLCQRIWQAHRVRVPYNHYFTNFAEWLRADRDLRQLVDDLLLADDCRLARTFVRPEWLRRVVREHRDGDVDHRSSIMYTLGMEIFLRQLETSRDG